MITHHYRGSRVSIQNEVAFLGQHLQGVHVLIVRMVRIAAKSNDSFISILGELQNSCVDGFLPYIIKRDLKVVEVMKRRSIGGTGTEDKRLDAVLNRVARC